MKKRDKQSIENLYSGNKDEDNKQLNESRYKTIFDNASVGIYETDAAGKCLLVNAQWCKFAGLTPEEAKGDGWTKALHPDDRVRIFGLWTEYASQQKSWDFEYRFCTPENRITWVAGTAIPLINNEGVTTGFLGMNTDISELKLAEDKLQSSYSLLQIAGKTARFGGWVHDLSKNRGNWSDEVAIIHEKPLGYVPNLEEAINFYAPEWRETILKAVNDCAGNGTPYDLELELITAKNNRIWVRTTGEAVRKKSGKITKIRGSFQDITGRKMEAEALRESEEKYRMLFEDMFQGVFYQLADGPFIDINPAGLKMFGLTRDQFLGRSSYHPEWKVVDEEQNILRPDQHPSMLALSTATEINKVVGVFNPDTQEFRWLNVNAKPQFKPAEDKPYQVFVTMHDITDRRLNELINVSSIHLVQFAQTHSLDEFLEETLNEAEKLTGSLIGFFHFVDENQKDIGLQTWSTRTKAQFCKANGKGLHYAITEAGIWVDCVSTRKPVIHNDYSSLSHKKGMPEGHATLTRELTLPILRNDKIKAILGIGNKPTDYTEKDIKAVSRFANFVWEIIERKLAEEALKKNEEIFTQLLEHSPIYVFFKDENIRSLRLSKNYEEMLGQPIQNLLGKSMDELFPSDLAKNMVADDLQILEEGKKIEIEEEFNGRHFTTIKFPIQIGDKPNYLAGFTIDVTKQKQAENELKANEIHLRELIATKDKFFSIVAHDLKNPFNAILGFSNLLAEQIKENDFNRIDEYAKYIQDSSQQVMDLLVNLMEWSRTQTGRLKFNPEFVEMVSLINEVSELMQASAIQKSITIVRKLPRNAPVFADKSMISTVLRNLISNALKFTNPSGEILISIEQNQQELIVSVADNGIGIKPSLIDKLFRIDENHSTLGTRNEKGTGLGLILCREFVEKHSGKVWVESEPGKGSKFSFTIPKA